MTRWQRRARLLIAVFGVVFAVFLARQFKPADATPGSRPVVPTEPGAIIEITGCKLQRVTLSREDVSIECDKQLTYADGSSKLLGVTMTSDEKNGDGRFTASGKEAVVAKDQSTIVLNGDVRLVSVGNSRADRARDLHERRQHRPRARSRRVDAGPDDGERRRPDLRSRS